jgi:predicted amidohydrolase
MPRIRGDGTPQLTLWTVMTKFLSLGMPLAEVIRATTIAPADAIGRGDAFGTLTPGAAADVTILSVEQGPVDLVDIYGNRRQGDRALRSIRTFIAGRQLEPSPLPPPLPWIRLVEQEFDGARSEGSQ